MLGCSRFLYPGIIALLAASVTYPLGTGQFIAGELSTHEQVVELFSNFTWTSDDLTVEQATIVTNWTTKYSNIFFNLAMYTIYTVSFGKNSVTMKRYFFYIPFSVYFFNHLFNNSGSIGYIHSCV